MRFAFISRHHPTDEQINLASERGIEIVSVGDTDAFLVDVDWVKSKGNFDGVIVVHPAAAMRLQSEYFIGVWENQNRAPEGEKPTFAPVKLHLFKPMVVTWVA